MANPANTGTLIGRVGKGGIKTFPNSDGSKKLKFSMAVDEDFVRNGKTQPDTDFIPVEVFIPKTGTTGSWDRVHEGDLIAVNTRLAYKPYQKDGKTVYPDGPTVEVDGWPRFLEPKSVTEKRQADKAVAAAAAPAQAAPAAPAAETPEQKIARLQAELQAAQGGYSTDQPFQG